jgi:hypothetical protein
MSLKACDRFHHPHYITHFAFAELIGEEIYDEFDPQGAHPDLSSYVPPAPVPPPPPTTRHDSPHSSSAVVSALALSHHLASALHLSSSSPKFKDEGAQNKLNDDLNHPMLNDYRLKGDPRQGNLKIKDFALMGKSKEDNAGDIVRPATSTTMNSTFKPMALKGLDFLRSRSAPPRPREPITTTSVTPNLHGEAELGNIIVSEQGGGDGESPKLSASPPIPAVDAQAELEINRTRSSPLSSPGKLSRSNVNMGDKNASPGSDVAGNAITVPNTDSVVSTPIFFTPISRAVSPTPSLEAILLDRKRRLNASAASSASSTIGAVGGSGSFPLSPSNVDSRPRVIVGTGAKGTRFKSSPLGGKERAGMRTGDGIWVNGAWCTEEEGVEVGNEVRRMPDGKDKEEPGEQG